MIYQILFKLSKGKPESYVSEKRLVEGDITPIERVANSLADIDVRNPPIQRGLTST